MNNYAVIVAGGVGKRMGEDVPKQFLFIGGRPILMHTMDAFIRYDKEIQIILVLPEEQVRYWQELCKECDFRINHIVRYGGETRFHSVKNGLKGIKPEEDSLIAVHDGVRPFVSKETLDRCFKTAREKGNAIPVVDINESVRMIEEIGNKSINREQLKTIQTPQVFQAKRLLDAYNIIYDESFTDSASVLERTGERIHMVKGDIENIKITTPFDLKVAEAILK
jgi:2-C-methyl-D-erythritol 4-phosphate cytidylyltransferase